MEKPYHDGTKLGTCAMLGILTVPWPTLTYWIGLVPAALVAGLAWQGVWGGGPWTAGRCWGCGAGWSAFTTWCAYRLLLLYNPFADLYIPRVPGWLGPVVLAAICGGAFTWALGRVIGVRALAAAGIAPPEAGDG